MAWNSKEIDGWIRTPVLGRDLDRSSRQHSATTRAWWGRSGARQPILRACDGRDPGTPDVKPRSTAADRDAQLYFLGRCLESMDPHRSVRGRERSMKPFAWTRTYRASITMAGSVFTTTMGVGADLGTMRSPF